MNTAFLLAAKYDGAPLINIDQVRKDYFSELSLATFVRRLEEGAIPLPSVRMSGSQKGKRMIPLSDLANYIDQLVERARKENDRK